ncbi:MAG: NAD-dependent epimerase/dehydratase family protein [Polaromonas sp.]
MLIDTNPVAISASLVLYKPDFATVERTLQALERAAQTASEFYELQLRLTLVDNSSDQNSDTTISDWFENFRERVPSWTLQLIQPRENLGYGRGNNLVIAKARSVYHLVINPDLFVQEDALLEAIRYMAQNQDVGLLTPAVFGEQGERHYMCKRNPTLLTMYLRSFSPLWLQSLLKPVVDSFEMRDCDYEKSIHPIEYPTGCFMFFRTQPLKEIGGFDPDYFLHYEDADIGRRILKIARVVYVPQVKVVHQWARDTHRSLKAKLITVRSGFLYWRKWGGFFSSRSTVELRHSRDAADVSSNSQVQVPSKQRVLVTGAGGFIGQAVCSDLQLRGHQVVGAVRQRNAVHESASVNYVSMGDMDDSTDWSSVVKEVDCVVHLAARVHLMNDTAQDPLAEFRRVNVDLTLNLARQAALAGARRFIFVSSVKVNGENTPFGQPFTAEDMPCPTDFYGISKHEAEQLLMQLAKTTGMEVVVVRPVLVYGPGVKANFYQMMDWLKKGVPLPLKALDNQRSMVALDNLVDMIAICLSHPAAANQTFLVSDGEDLTVSDLMERTSLALGRRARLLTMPMALLKLIGRIFGKQAVIHRLCEPLQVDIMKSRQLLGWCPPVPVDIALKKTANWYLGGK